MTENPKDEKHEKSITEGYILNAQIAWPQMKLDIITEIDGQKWKLAPKKTITAYETTRLAMLMFCVPFAHGCSTENAIREVFEETRDQWELV